MITTDAKCHRVIKRMSAIEKEAFSERRELLRRRLYRNLKKRMVKTLLGPIEGRTAWTMRKEHIHVTRLEALEL